MVDISKTIEVLHGLVLVNNDRIKWYEQAITEVQEIEPSLAELFDEFAEDSRFYAEELDEKIKVLGTGDGISSSTMNGKIFRIWSDLKSALSNNPVESVLSSSEHVEDRVQEAYTRALADADHLDENTIQILEQHQVDLKSVHDKVKAYRDQSSME